MARAAAYAAAIAAVAALLPAGPAAAEGGSLKLGVVTFLSGPPAGPFGIPARNAAELLIEAINMGGKLPAPYDGKGFGGATLDPLIIDEQGSATEVVQNYRDLVQRRGANAVIGFISSGNCLAVAPVAEELKTITVFFDCGTPRIFEDDDHHYLFRPSATATIDSTSAARYVASHYPDLKSFTGINQNYAWGQDSWSDFEAAIKDLKPGIKEDTPLFPKLYAGQYSTEITTLLTEDAEFVHSSFWGGDLESLLLQGVPRGLFQKKHFFISTAETTMFRLGAKIPDGMIMGARGPWGVYAHNDALNQWFRQAYTDRYGAPPVYPSYQMAASMLGMKLAYDNAAKANPNAGPEDVVKAFTGLDYTVFGTRIEMALGKGRQGVQEIAQGTYKYDKASGTPTITDIVYYPPECVTPPEGTKAADWIKDGMKGAKNCP